MTRMSALVWVGLKSGRSFLPLIATLAVSATVAYAVSAAVVSSSLASGPRTELELAAPTGGPSGIAPFELQTEPLSAALTEPHFTRLPELCSESGVGPMHVGIDAWIVAENHRFACRSVGR